MHLLVLLYPPVHCKNANKYVINFILSIEEEKANDAVVV